MHDAAVPCYEATSQLAGEACVERIVVGTDLTERSSGAVSMAAELAAQLKATLHLVSTCPMPTVSMGPEIVIVPDHGGGRRVRQEPTSTRSPTDLRSQGLTVEIHTPIGDAADGLCSVAETMEPTSSSWATSACTASAGCSAAFPTGWPTRRPAAS